jgi:tetratricopeptide (TPR) repeat protein
MTGDQFSDKIGTLFRRGAWETARKLLQRERDKDPDNHWLLTQLGVTFYEQGRYDEALPYFRESLRIVPDCPLTLWNLAGTLDALGRSREAIPIYAWLLASEKSPADDPCWESREWADALKADCAYRLAVCFEHLGKKGNAERWYRQYVDLLLKGIDGSYAIEDAMLRIRGLHVNGNHGGREGEVRKAVKATLQASGIEPRKARRRPLPDLKLGKLKAGRRLARKSRTGK